MTGATLVLASKSQARKAMLEKAGVLIEARASDVDEDALKVEGMIASDLAEALAKAKAADLSQHMESELVLGGDQVLLLEDGSMLDKPWDKDDARRHLQRLSGTKHKLFSAAAIAEKGSIIWHHTDMAAMTMRSLSDKFIDQYVEREWDNIRGCVGCYEIEGRGVQLFSKIQGSQFTIMGLPLLPVLEYLRVRGVISS